MNAIPFFEAASHGQRYPAKPLCLIGKFNPLRRGLGRVLVLAGMLALIGCASAPDGTGIAAAAGDEGAREPFRPPTGEIADAGEPSRLRSASPAQVADPALSLQQGAGAYIYSHDLTQLESEVARACEGARRSGEPDILRSLVADLYFSGVHPAAATEALLNGDCGGVDAVVEEMVAQGGDASQEAVVTRARMVQGHRAGRRIDSAAAAGLARRAGLAEVALGLAQDALPTHGMLYFPSVAESSKLVTTVALNRLYEDAVPGYGIYTFVLCGRGFNRPSGDDAARYSELFRMLETYVSSVDGEDGQPSAAAHVFLVPINPEKLGAPLIDQTAVDLSDAMRGHLIQSLRRQGQRTLASRLETGAGPFLVATLEPSLVPTDPRLPWLVTDLSEMGPEHVYGVVDAFDRSIAPDLSGRPESLGLIRKRLLELPLSPARSQGAKAASNDWVFMLGDFGQRLARAGGGLS